MPQLEQTNKMLSFDPGCRRDRLSLIGVGAAVRLQPAPNRKVYQLATPLAFRAPETISGVLLETNLRSLLRMDAWSVGVLVAMVASQVSAAARHAHKRSYAC